MALVTKAKVRTNGFSHMVQAEVNREKRTFFFHVSRRYDNAAQEIDNEQFNLFTREIEDKKQISQFKSVLTSFLLENP